MNQHQNKAAEILRTAGILPVITIETTEQALRLADALLEGGLRVLELTLRTQAALQALSSLKKAHPELIIGAGTVRNAQHIKQSIDAGADFLVTPGTTNTLIDALAHATVPSVPGAATPSELLRLMENGFYVCKLFPATVVGGIGMLKSLAGPLADLKLCPTGGITENNARDFLMQPNVLCVGGSWMVPIDWVRSGAWEQIRTSTARAKHILTQLPN